MRFTLAAHRNKKMKKFKNVAKKFVNVGGLFSQPLLLLSRGGSGPAPMMYDGKGGKSFPNIILFAWHLQQSHKSHSSLIRGLGCGRDALSHPAHLICGANERLRQSLTNSIIFPITKGGGLWRTRTRPACFCLTKATKIDWRWFGWGVLG